MHTSRIDAEPTRKNNVLPKPRMLFISPEFPWPPSSGGRLRTISLLHCLAPRFDIHCVTYAQIPPSPAEIDCLRAYAAEITVLPLRPHSTAAVARYTRNIGRMLRFVPPLVDRFSEPENRSVITALIANADYVWLEHLWLAPFVSSVRAGAVSVLDAHNVESEYYAQLRAASGKSLDRVGYGVFAKAARNIERTCLPRFDRVLAVSEDDRRLLARDCPERNVFVAPNAVQLAPCRIPADAAENGIYFAGRLDYLPNREAVLWFAREAWPAVRMQAPTTRWNIIGAAPELLGAELRGDSHILLAGEVQSTARYLHSSAVVIVPVSSGGGTRFKILDAWAAGKAVVSTTKGAEGLEARHAENIWIADNGPDFAAAVVRLLSDHTLRETLENNGWKTVEKLYSWERLAQRLDSALGISHRCTERGCA